jgi:hypothetical protein
MDELRRELAELFREDDRLRAEHDDWQAQREAQAQALVRKSEPEDVLYRVCDNIAPAPATYREPEPFNEEQADALAHLINLLREEWRTERATENAERNEKLSALREQVAELRGTVNALLTLVGKSQGFGNMATDAVIDLPKNFWRKPDAA